jgi:hypothetical protein
MPGSSWLLCNGWCSVTNFQISVLDHRIIARNGLIAPLVGMTCRLLLGCVASPAPYRASGFVR